MKGFCFIQIINRLTATIFISAIITVYSFVTTSASGYALLMIGAQKLATSTITCYICKYLKNTIPTLRNQNTLNHVYFVQYF